MSPTAAHTAGLLDVETVAQKLGVPVSWVYNRAATGKMPAIKIGKYLRFDAEELSAWLAQHRHGRKGNGHMR